VTSRFSYVYDPRTNGERARLKEREKQTKNQRAAALEGVRFEGVETILDVGCGTGVVGFDLLQLIPTAHFVGVDIEFSILPAAQAHNPAGGPCHFLAGDVFSLPFRQSSFDLVACQYVLQHLPEPVKALAEMRRVCRPGGRAVVFEFDDQTSFSYPPPPTELQQLYQAKVELIERKGGDRSIGRKLYHLLHTAGWTDIHIKIIPNVWQGPGERASALESAYLSFTRFEPQLMAEGLIAEKTVKLGLEQLYTYYQGDVFSVIFFFAAFARNPGSGIPGFYVGEGHK
jgi:ubiquinone/menaquinone biosynthesis C-methylase UbiE